MRVLLYDYFVVSREPLLRRHLHTNWDIVGLPDTSDRTSAREAVADVDAFIGNEFPPDLTDAARKLRLLHCVGAGVDKFDPAALPPGLLLCNVHEHEIPIAEYVMLACLLFTTRLDYFRGTFRQGRWDGSARGEGEFHREIHGQTLGIIGLGHIGRTVAARAHAFGMRVIAVTPHPQSHPNLDWCGALNKLGTLLSESDFVAIACPLTDQTRGMIGEPELRGMKPGAVLINTSRAAIVQEQPLYRALTERWIAGAALDVWYDYPADASAVMHGSKLPFHKLENVIATPHLSAWTEPMIERRYRRIAENLDRFARDEPVHRVVYKKG